jgi:hypothetical protein
VSTAEQDSLRRAAQLRGEVARLGREPQRPGFIVRAFEFAADALMLVLLIVLAIDGWLAYRAFHAGADSPASGSMQTTDAAMDWWPYT